MKAPMMVGIFLIVIGLACLVYPGFTYREHKKVLDIGPIEAHETKDKTVPIPPIVGVLAVASGIALVIAGRK